MLRKLSLLLYSCVAVALLSCGGRSASGEPTAEGDSLAFKYASLLSITQHEGYTIAEIKNPWKPDKLLHRYILVDRKAGTGNSDNNLPEGTVIKIPLERTAVFTTVHCALLAELGVGGKIAAVADSKYIKIPFIQQQLKAGKIVDCGNGLNPMVEKIMDVKPDAIMLSPFENSGGYGKLEEINIPIIECAEYMETSPRGRAEWMRFYGLLYGVSQKADSLFEEIDKGYETLKQRARKTGKGRSVVIDKMVGSVWYMPAGHSTIGQMLQDAGARYAWAQDQRSGSLSLPFETVLEKAGESDVWMLRYSADKKWSLKDLQADHQGYDQLKAFRTKEVYGCNVEQSLFYEKSPFHPDYLLSDFIQIVHPGIKDLPQKHFYERLRD
jgi:iron complex transport system substrate-binding protein